MYKYGHLVCKLGILFSSSCDENIIKGNRVQSSHLVAGLFCWQRVCYRSVWKGLVVNVSASSLSKLLVQQTSKSASTRRLSVKTCWLLKVTIILWWLQIQKFTFHDKFGKYIISLYWKTITYYLPYIHNVTHHSFSPRFTCSICPCSSLSFDRFKFAAAGKTRVPWTVTKRISRHHKCYYRMYRDLYPKARPFFVATESSLSWGEITGERIILRPYTTTFFT